MKAEMTARLRDKLQRARRRLFNADEEFAAPLYVMNFSAVDGIYRMSTNGKCVFFDHLWLQKLSGDALVFMLAHQLMHIKLRHIFRGSYFRGDRFHLAADIVANARLCSMGLADDHFPYVGTVRTATVFPVMSGADLSAEEAIHGIPFDPKNLPTRQRNGYMIDSDEKWDDRDDTGESGTIVLRPSDPDPYADADLIARVAACAADQTPDEGESAEKERINPPPVPDVLPSPCDELENMRKLNELRHRVGADIREKNDERMRGRVFQRPTEATVDWKRFLDSFVREELRDYSFVPPDRRFSDDCFLPDFNVCRETPKQALFMVDTSASVSDEMLSAVLTEIRGAVDCIGEGMTGTLAFFDSQVFAPTPISQIVDSLGVKPQGGGGTNFHCVFDFAKRFSAAGDLSCIIVFTDGKAQFPSESEAGGIPTLWLLTGGVTPPWGKYARIG